MDAWGTLDIGAAIVRDDLSSSFRRTKKLVSKKKFMEFRYVILKIVVARVAFLFNFLKCL